MAMAELIPNFRNISFCACTVYMFDQKHC